jgi:hypothetical protein
VTLELGGPWAFYRKFWEAHGIEHLGKLFSPEAQVAPGESLWVPLLLRNDTDSEQQVTLHSTLPAGWSAKPNATVYTIAPHDSYPIELTISSSATQKGTWQTLTWTADSGGRSIGTATLRVDVVSNGLPQ